MLEHFCATFFLLRFLFVSLLFLGVWENIARARAHVRPTKPFTWSMSDESVRHLLVSVLNFSRCEHRQRADTHNSFRRTAMATVCDYLLLLLWSRWCGGSRVWAVSCSCSIWSVAAFARRALDVNVCIAQSNTHSHVRHSEFNISTRKRISMFAK